MSENGERAGVIAPPGLDVCAEGLRASGERGATRFVLLRGRRVGHATPRPLHRFAATVAAERFVELRGEAK
eukprot:2530366-Pyramimonas_sp.AAC.1